MENSSDQVVEKSVSEANGQFDSQDGGQASSQSANSKLESQSSDQISSKYDNNQLTSQASSQSTNSQLGSQTIITLNVGGRIFESTYEILSGSSFLAAFMDRWRADSGPIRINRLPALFDHVLGYLIDPAYPYPRQHLSELDYYGVNHNFIPQEDVDSVIAKLVVMFPQLGKKNRCLVESCDKEIKDGEFFCVQCSVCYPGEKYVPVVGTLVGYGGRVYYYGRSSSKTRKVLFRKKNDSRWANGCPNDEYFMRPTVQMMNEYYLEIKNLPGDRKACNQ